MFAVQAQQTIIIPICCQALSYDTVLDVAIGQGLVSDMNLACAVLIRQKTQSDGDVTVYQLPKQLILSDIALRQSLRVDRALMSWLYLYRLPSVVGSLYLSNVYCIQMYTACSVKGEGADL